MPVLVSRYSFAVVSSRQSHNISIPGMWKLDKNAWFLTELLLLFYDIT